MAIWVKYEILGMISNPIIFQNGQGFHFQGAEPGTSPPQELP